MRPALCALALILLLPNAIAADVVESTTLDEPPVCDPVNIDDEPPFVEVYPHCVEQETAAGSK